MHYKNGRPARAGDRVINLPLGVVGIVHSVQAENQSCNARLAVTSANDPYVTLGECLHMDDVSKADVPASSV